MINNSNNELFTNLNEAVQDAITYIAKRASGEEKPLKTAWNELNKSILGGLNFNEVNLLAGMSSSGKTLFASQLESSIIELNKDVDFAILNFNFEMTSKMLAIRKISAKYGYSVGQLLSSETPLKKEEIEKIAIYKDELSTKGDMIYYHESPKSVEGLKNVIDLFYEKVNKPFVVILDHALLIKRTGGQTVNDMADEFSKMLIEYKKKYKCSFFILSQLNRSIEAAERKNPNSILNYPQRSDIYYVESIYHACDNVIILHRPSMLHIGMYGPEKIKVDANDCFFHVIKSRNGKTVIIRAKINGEKMSINELTKNNKQ